VWVCPQTQAPGHINNVPAKFLLDTGAEANSVTPETVKRLGLEVYPTTGQNCPFRTVKKIVGVGGHLTDPLGYVLVRVRLDSVKGYHSLQPALVVPDPQQEFDMTLGMPGLHAMFSVMKETELREGPYVFDVVRHTGYVGSRRAAVWINPEEEEAGVDPPKAPLKDPSVAPAKPDGTFVPTDEELPKLDQMVRTTEQVILEPHSTHTVSGMLAGKNPLRGFRANVITYGLTDAKKYPMPLGVTVANCYTQLALGSRRISVVVRNDTPNRVKLDRHQCIARVDFANVVHSKPPKDPAPATEASPKLTLSERQEAVIERMATRGIDKIKCPKVKRIVTDMLREYHDVFSLDAGEIGRTSLVEHEIKLTDSNPFKDRASRIPPNKVEAVRQMLQEMLDAGAIRHSSSPWSNAIVLVRKKGGDLRFCIDFRKLNDKTVKDAYPLPRINETMDALSKARYFTCLDLKSGFWQTELAEWCKPYTAFSAGHLGFFEFERMPFGLCNAPATFQRLMQRCLGELNMTHCIIYLDDIIVFSATEEEHAKRLRAVLARLRENGLKLQPKKCELFREEIEYLGHKVSGDGVRPGTDNVAAIKALSPPATYTEVRSFLGMVGHYRRFVKDFAKIAGPLNSLLTGENADKKKEAVELSEPALRAFHALKERITTEPVLVFADCEKPFLLETDASKEALGAVLSQKQADGKYHPVAYASRTTNGAEKGYHSSKLEFLALKWAVTEKFKEYLLYSPFEVRTDNNPLTYIHTTPNLDATGHRWVAALADFNFSLKYLKGKDNKVADALSRLPTEAGGDEEGASADLIYTLGRAEELPPSTRPAKCTFDMGEEEVGETIALARLGTSKRLEVAREELYAEGVRLQDEIRCKAARLRVELKDVTDWVEEQKADPALDAMLKWLAEKNRTPRTLRQLLAPLQDPPTEASFMASRNLFVVKQGILYRKYETPFEPLPVLQFVVPRQYRRIALDGCHKEAGHQGQRRTITLAKDRFWWPSMDKYITDALRNCQRCIAHEAKASRPPLQPILSTAPMDLVHMDFMTAEIPGRLNKPARQVNILTITDHFTRHVTAFVTPDQKASTVAEYLWKRYLSIYGFPARILSDQGRNFESKIIAELCSLMGVKKIRTTPHHPQTNGQVERAHQTLQRMIGKLERDQKEDWPAHLSDLVFAYNCTRSAITGYSPYYLMFGRRPRLPVDFYFPTCQSYTKAVEADEYVAQLRDRLRTYFKQAQAASEQEAARQKRHYDARSHAVELLPGDQVLGRILAYVGKRKLVDKWETIPHTVVRRMAPDSPSYILEDEQGNRRSLHRRHIYLVTPIQGTACQRKLEVLDQAELEAEIGRETSLKQLRCSSDGAAAQRVLAWFDRIRLALGTILWAWPGGGRDRPPEKEAD